MTHAADPVVALDKAMVSIKSARAAIAQIHVAASAPDERVKHAECYALLRRVLVAQFNGNFEIGEKFAQVMQEDGAPQTEAEFDRRMEAALKAMGSK